MEQFSSHDSNPGDDSTLEAIDMAPDDTSLYLPELLEHLAIRGVEGFKDLSPKEVDYLIRYFASKALDPDSDGLSPLEESILNKLYAYDTRLDYTDDLNSQPLAQVR